MLASLGALYNDVRTLGHCLSSLSKANGTTCLIVTMDPLRTLGNQNDTTVVPESKGPVSGGMSADFARLLAATIRQNTQRMAMAAFQPTPSRAEQLSFLQQPSSTSLPLFMMAQWFPRQGAEPSPRSSQEPSQRPPQVAPPVNALPVDPRQNTAVSGAGAAPQGQAVDSPLGNLSGVAVLPRRIERDLAVAGPNRGAQNASPLPLSAFPRPPADNGRGIHWIPTTRQAPQVIDKYVQEAVDMGIKWVTFLNDGTNVGANDYLVKKLVENGIEPVMRIYTDGGARISGDLSSLVRHYKALGVNYYQLYNEPNLRIENQGQAPDPKAYVDKWLPAAKAVIEAGGYPGFGSLSPTPGLAPGAAPGDMDDLKFLREGLQEIKRRGETGVLDRSWLSVHNYGRAHLRVRDYDRIVQEELGRSMPQIGTEAGIYPGDTLSEEEAVQVVAQAYNYLPQREDYYFAYTYWIIANESGQGAPDRSWDHQALFRGGSRSPLVDLLKQEV